MYKAEVKVMLKAGVLDPQGKAVQGSLATLGYTSVESVRIGRLIEVLLEAKDMAAAERQVDEMCRKLLSNPVIESYTYTVAVAPAAKASGNVPVVPPGVVF